MAKRKKKSGGATPKVEAPVKAVEKNEPVVIAEAEGLPTPPPQAEEVVVEKVQVKAAPKKKVAKVAPPAHKFIY